MLDLSTLRIHFNAGDLVQAQVVPAPMQEGWMLTFTRKNGDEVVLTRARTTRPRVLKRLDTVKELLTDIGFRDAVWRVAC